MDEHQVELLYLTYFDDVDVNTTTYFWPYSHITSYYYTVRPPNDI